MILTKAKDFFIKNNKTILVVLSSLIPFIFYTLTLQKNILPDRNEIYALYIPEMRLLPPTGYPIYSIFLKLFTLIPLGTLTYKLNLF